MNISNIIDKNKQNLRAYLEGLDEDDSLIQELFLLKKESKLEKELKGKISDENIEIIDDFILETHDFYFDFKNIREMSKADQIALIENLFKNTVLFWGIDKKEFKKNNININAINKLYATAVSMHFSKKVLADFITKSLELSAEVAEVICDKYIEYNEQLQRNYIIDKLNMILDNLQEND